MFCPLVCHLQENEIYFFSLVRAIRILALLGFQRLKLALFDDLEKYMLNALIIIRFFTTHTRIYVAWHCTYTQRVRCGGFALY